MAVVFLVLIFSTSLQTSDAFRSRGGAVEQLSQELSHQSSSDLVASDTTSTTWGVYKEVNPSEAESTLKARNFQFIEGEKIGLAYKKGKDNILLTNKRYLHCDSWKLSGRITYRSVAWSSVILWSVESPGTMEFIRPDTELRIWTDMPAFPYRMHKFAADKADIYKMQKYIADRVVGVSSSSLIEMSTSANNSRAGTAALPQWLTDDSKEIDAKEVERTLRANGGLDILQDDERVDMAFRAWRDMMVFTSKRIIDIDIKGLGGAIEYKSLPFKYVRAFSIETAGGGAGIFGDKDVEMCIWTPVAGYSMHSYYKEFKKKGADIFAIGAYLSSRAFNVPYTYKRRSSLLQESTSWGDALAWLGGDASAIDPRQAEAQFHANSNLPVLLEGEHVLQAYKVGRDSTLMTDYRILFIDVKGMSGKKVEFKSLPYTSVRAFAVESAGGWDLDAELDVWTDIHYDPPGCSPCSEDCSDCHPRPGMSFVSQDFRKGRADIFAVFRLLSSKVFGSSVSSLVEAGAKTSSNSSDFGPGGLLAWLGNDASEVSPQMVQAKFSDPRSPILMPGETVEMAFKVGRDFTTLTNQRILLVDTQGMSGKKVEYLTVPYSSVTGFAVESAGSFDLDAEMKFYTAMWWRKSTIQQDLRKGRVDIQKIANHLARKVLGGRGAPYRNSLVEESSYSSERGPGGDAIAWLSNNAREIDPKEAERIIRQSTSVMLDDEAVIMAYKVGRDTTLLTTKRLLYVDVKGFSGKKVEWASLPWSHVQSYKITTAAKLFDNDAEFKVCTNAIGAPKFKQDLRKGKTDVHALEKVLADHMFVPARGSPAIRTRLVKFFQHYEPQRLSLVDQLLVKFQGKEQMIFPMLVKKYGPEP